MVFNLDQFLQTFQEDCLEMLQKIEKILLEIEPENIREEQTDTILRFMHSMKSNSAVFGFDVISQFLHFLEIYINELRSGKRIMTHEDINLLLQGVDCLRDMIVNAKSNEPIEDSCITKFKSIFESKTNQLKSLQLKSHQPSLSLPEDEILKAKLGWNIFFHPDRDIFQMGNDPYRLFDILAELGKITITVNASELPSILEFDPTQCYLTWQIKLYGEVSKAELMEVFIWIVNESNVTLTPLEEITTLPAEPALFSELPSSPLDQKEVSPLPAYSTRVVTHMRVEQQVSVRVSTEKIDNLMNIVGELIIAKSTLYQTVKDFDMSRLAQLHEAISYVEHNFRELQQGVMNIRMVPLEFIFNRMPRMVHDVSEKMKKKVDLVIAGEQTELDKNMIEKISDPLIHLVRNALYHGIETPEVRKKQGKNPTGLIQLNAYQEGGKVVIDVIDDGAGLNLEKIRAKAMGLKILEDSEELTEEKIYRIIFKLGFTTAQTVTEVSGFGIGLDVVRRNVYELGGEVELKNILGKGCIFRMRLPLTLIIMDCQLVRTDDQTYIIPLMDIIEIIQVDPIQVNQLDNKNFFYHFRDGYIPIVFLKEVFSMHSSSIEWTNKFLIIFISKNKFFGLLVDELLLQQQVVIKSLEDNYKSVVGISGATILGSGEVALILDMNFIANLVLHPEIIFDKKPDFLAASFKTSELPIPSENEELKESGEYLGFLLGKQEYAIEMTKIKEIRMYGSPTFLPNVPEYIKGVINFHGKIVPVVDLHERFELPLSNYTQHTVIIILSITENNKTRFIGIIADQVMATIAVNYTQITPLTEMHNLPLKQCVYGLLTVNNQMITLLNTENLVLAVTKEEV